MGLSSWGEGNSEVEECSTVVGGIGGTSQD